MKKQASPNWAAELAKTIEDETLSKHPGEGWLTKEEVREQLATGMPNEHVSDYKLRGFLTTLKANGRVDVCTRYIPDDRGERRKQVFYKLLPK